MNGLRSRIGCGKTETITMDEDCDDYTYVRLMSTLKDVDLTKVQEIEDNTNLSGEIACAGGACEVKYV